MPVTICRIIIIDMIIIAIILMALLIFLSLTRNIRNGRRGEFLISVILKRLPKEEYFVLNDLMIENGIGGTSQIDHLVLSIYGIFVIETKNYSGLIYGGEYSEEWTKNRYGNKYSFRNPIKQNYGHIKALSKLLDLPLNAFIPIVVFTGRATLKGDFESPVLYPSELLKEIKYHNTPRFNTQQIEEYKTIILNTNRYDNKDRRKHVKDIKEHVHNKEMLIRNGICPKCRGKLIQRNGRYGTFYGCSNYPKCRYVLNI